MTLAQKFSNIYHDRRFRGLVLPAVLIVLWALATQHKWVSSLILVPFGDLLDTMLDTDIMYSLLDGLGSTFVRQIQGCLIGITVGLVLGIGMGLSNVFDRIFGPSFHAVRQVAILAWIPLLTAWFGNGDLCKIVFVAIAASKPVVMGTFEGVRNAPVQLIEVGRSLGFSRLKMLRYVILPAATPAIITAIQLSLIFSWFAAIGAEYVIGVMSGGIGSVVTAARELFRTDIVLIGVALISATGILMNKGLRQINKRLFPWQKTA